MSKVRGLAIEISADASRFEKQLKEIKKDGRNTQTELSALSKALELDYNEETFLKAQAKAKEAIDVTAQTADVLRDRLKFLEEKKSVDTTEYRKIQSELAKTETEGLKLKKQLEQINQIKYDKLAAQVDNVGNKIQTAGKVVSVASGIAAGGLAALTAAGKSAVATADELATTAAKYQITTTALQRMNYVAMQTDISQNDLYNGLVKVRAASTDLANGIINNSSKALQQLNIDFSNLSNSDEQFFAIVQALGDMEDKTQMVAMANEIFGDKLANQLIPLIDSGSEAINEYAREFDTLGALTDEQVDKLASFDNVLNKLKTQFQNLTLRIGAVMLPILEKFADIVGTNVIPKLEQFANWFEKLSEKQVDFVVKALMVVAALGPVLIILGKLTSGVGGLIQIIPKLNASLTTLAANPVVLIIGVIAAILALLFMRSEEFRESIMNLIGALSGALMPVLNAVMGALTPVFKIIGNLAAILGNILAGAIGMIINQLTPMLDMFIFFAQLLEPLMQFGLLPLQIALQNLELPLKMIGALIGWLGDLFGKFRDFIGTIMNVVLGVVNEVLGFIEDKINWVIGKINSLIDGVNRTLGWMGVNIDRFGEVSFRVDNNTNVNAGGGSFETDDFVYDKVDTSGSNNPVYNYDYSHNDTTQNVTITIQNYAAEVDIDAMVSEINIKLAELR